MSVCVPGARPNGSLSRLFVLVACFAIPLFAPNAARADDLDIYVFVSQYDGSEWAIEGWVFADDPYNLPVTITGLPDGSTVTAYTDDTGYFLYLVDVGSSQLTTITATVTDDDMDTASDSFVVS
jgi:hypothetical protein